MKEGEPVLGGPQANPGSTAPSKAFGPQSAGLNSGLPQMPTGNLTSQPPAPIYRASQFSAFSNNSMTTTQPDALFSSPNTSAPQSNASASLLAPQLQQPPMQPQIITDDHPVILDSGKKKHRAATLATIVIIALSTIVVAIVIILNQKASASFAENAQSLYESLDWLSHTSQCPRLAMELDNIYYTDEEYKVFADNCRNNASRIEWLITALNNRGDQEFRNIYAILVPSVRSSVVFGDNLEQEIALYADWHEFILNTQSVAPLVYDDDIEDAAAPLINSSNIVLKKFGEQWLQKQLELRFWQANVEIFPGNIKSQELLSVAKLNLQEFTANHTPDIIGMTKIGSKQDNPELRSALFELKSYIKENL